ncbi:hypothetical protein M8J75_012588 [Diaphorina citri]|nr:hypothetical protein M8J75_012588 [Diaphorina citri]
MLIVDETATLVRSKLLFLTHFEIGYQWRRSRQVDMSQKWQHFQFGLPSMRSLLQEAKVPTHLPSSIAVIPLSTCDVIKLYPVENLAISV